MPGLIEVIYCPNPLMMVSRREIKRLYIDSSDTVDSAIKRLGLGATRVKATLNSVPVRRRRRAKKRVYPGDVLVLVQRARDPGTATLSAKIIMDFAWYEIAAQAALVALAYIGPALALSFLANVFSKKASTSSSDDSSSPSSYSITGGSNTARQYGPLLVTLGEHRLYPDYGSAFFSEFVQDPVPAREVTNNGWVLTRVEEPGWSGGFQQYPNGDWEVYDIHSPEYPTLYTQEVTYMQYNSIGTALGQVTVSIMYNGTVGSTGYGEYALRSEAEPLLLNSEDPPWRAWNADPQVVPSNYQYGTISTDVFKNTERLTNVFNLGFGDFATVADMRIGSTSLSQYTNWQADNSVVPAGQRDRTTLDGYESPVWAGTDYPTSVQPVEGGNLEQHTGIANDGWMERRGTGAIFFVAINLAGRLFSQGGSGIGSRSVTFEAAFRLVGAADWTAFGFSPITLNNSDTTPVRESFRQYMPADGQYEVRVRRVSPDETDANNVSDFELTSVNFYRRDNTLYPAQRRLGLMVQATGQLNGQLDRFSCFVQVKHWVWASGAAWTDGVYPGDGAAPWAWTTTTNPAYLFLYYARGGFLNSAATPAYMGGGQGWLDRPDAANGVRLFGAGLQNSRIDYATIIAWAQFCDAHGLQCRMVIDEQRNCGDVLDDIAAAGHALKTWAPGKLSVIWEAPDQPTVASFGMSNIIAGSFQIAYDTDDVTDEYVMDFTDSSNDYASATVRATVPGVDQPTNSQSTQANYSMSTELGQRLVNLLAAAKFYRRRTITWDAPYGASVVQRGDVVALAHDLTQWAFSGRLLSMTAAGGQITAVRTSCAVENTTGAGEFYIWVRRPDDSFVSYEVVPPIGRTRDLVLKTAWPVAEAPGVLGTTRASQNAASEWPQMIPEDFTFFAGPTATPGKRVRIVSMVPKDNNQIGMTARDEFAEYYPLEYSLDGTHVVPTDDQLVARAYNLTAHPADAGGYRLDWELENANGAEIMLSVNGGAEQQVPIRGYLTVSGRELLLPAYPAGTTLGIRVLPVAAGVPVAIQGDSLNLVL